MVQRLADDGGVALVEVSLLHLLELVRKKIVHQGWQLSGPLVFAVFLVALQLVEAGVHVEHKFVEVLHAILADISLHVQQELA